MPTIGMPMSSINGTSHVGPMVTTLGRGIWSATMVTTMMATHAREIRNDRRCAGVRAGCSAAVDMRRT